MKEVEDNPLPGYDFKAGTMLLVDKPQDWTSFDVVNKIRHKIKRRLGVKKIKVGHAGTLDPMATGLLIICTGKATKTIDGYQGMPKTYTGTIRLGSTTPSFDAETPVDAQYPIDHITNEAIEAARQQFIGDLEQIPPVFSAIKVDGQPLYKKARKGIEVKVEPRPVSIYSFEVTRIDLPEVDFEVRCSKGTYIRSLAHDFGKALDSGAHLIALRRTAIGEYKVNDAWQIEDLVKIINEGPIVGAVTAKTEQH
ncbi:MAG: tRNA pseudouridine(55) synthase TruB [Saprospiraceae bacterium]